MPDELPDKTCFERTKVLLTDSEAGQAGIEAARIAAKHNVPVVIDVESDGPHIAEAMALSTHIIVSQDFAADYTGQADITAMLPAMGYRPRSS